jgi:hypothetical protein
LPPNLSRGRHAPLQIVPRHMQLSGGSINPFLSGHLDCRRPKLSGNSGFPSAIASPFLETASCFFQRDNPVSLRPIAVLPTGSPAAKRH